MPRHHGREPAARHRSLRESGGGLRSRYGSLRCGFTLVELLVVVAIIALLAGILMPVFARAREKGRQSYCLSNLKQMAMAMMFYTEDFDGFYPPAVGHAGRRPVDFSSSWMGILAPYVKDPAVFIDLSSGHPNEPLRNYAFAPTVKAQGYPAILLTVDPWGTALWEGIGGFYGSPVGWYVDQVPSRNVAQIARPTETVLICDHTYFEWGVLNRQMRYPSPRHIREQDIQLPDGFIAPSGLINAVFIDGHVKGMKHEQFWQILHGYSSQFGFRRDVYKHFWPDE
jgi:prepilin-type N-terminal cleavage/methylation domain-containing protein/prepilin-type processing-associated H-X9-DG protein